MEIKAKETGQSNQCVIINGNGEEGEGVFQHLRDTVYSKN